MGLPARDRLLASDAFILVVTGAAFAAFALSTPGFASPATIENLLVTALPLLLLAAGQTCVLITAGIDLSAPALVGLASIAGGLVMSEHVGTVDGAIAPAAGVAAMLATGAVAGAVNGVAVAWLRMPAFMVTLATFTFAGGLSVWLARARAGSDTIDGIPAALVDPGATIWVPALVTLALLAGAELVLARTLAGRWLRAVGQNAGTARVCGVPVQAVTAAAYVVSGLSAALAALLVTARLETASPLHGRPWLLDVIGAAVLGGTSLFGGRGAIRWTACGVLFLSLLATGLTLHNLSDFTITIVKGGVILLAALLDVSRTRWGRT